MKNKFFILMVSVAIFAMSPVFAMEEDEGKRSPYLHWQQRPQEVVEAINATFLRISNGSESEWFCNGKTQYQIGEVEEKKLFHHLLKSNPDQKEFTFLDIGAGDFQWGDSSARAINALTDISEDVRVNIIGVRGEYAGGPQQSCIGKCNIYKIGNFKIENLEEEFNARGLNLTGSVDVLVTNMCFIHLVDPMGTLQQAYNLLRPQTGLFFGEGFLYGLGKGEEQSEGAPSFDNVTKLLLDMNVPFLIQPYERLGKFNNFVFQRNGDAPLKLPLMYRGTVELGNNSIISSKKATTFEHIGPEPEWTGVNPYPWAAGMSYGTLCGDEKLFHFFYDNDLFYLPKFKKFSSLTRKL